MSSKNPVFSRFKWLSIGVAAVFVYGVVGYLLFGFGFWAAAYMTGVELTTAGFAPHSEMSTSEEMFTLSIAVLGVLVFFALIAIVADAFAEGLLGTGSRRRKMQRRIDQMRNHFIVCAYGRVGRAVCGELEGDGVPFVVIDLKEELSDQMAADGVDFLIGDPTRDAVLKSAGIEHARGLVCAVDSDESNVYITLTGRSLNSELYIVARASRRSRPRG